jgi:acyl carrier protein
MELSEFVAAFESELEDVQPGSLTALSRFKELDVWDSMVMLSVIAMIDRKYNKQISGKDLESADTLESLFERIKTK